MNLDQKKAELKLFTVSSIDTAFKLLRHNQKKGSEIKLIDVLNTAQDIAQTIIKHVDQQEIKP